MLGCELYKVVTHGASYRVFGRMQCIEGTTEVYNESAVGLYHQARLAS